jgi:hypothetical protein
MAQWDMKGEGAPFETFQLSLPLETIAVILIMEDIRDPA